jgi:cytochrome b561
MTVSLTLPEGRAAERYGRVAIALHWAIGIALLAQIAFGFLLDDIAPRGTPARTGVINLHKSTGIVLGVFILARLAWRVRHRPPPWPADFTGARGRLATLGHRALYACMVGMPLSGYVASNFTRYGVRFFGTPLPPWGPADPRLYAVFNGLHVALGFALTLLIAGHVAVAIGHALRDRGALFARMLPARPPPARSHP